MIDWKNLGNKLQERGSKAELSRKTGISTGNISDWFNPNKNAQPSVENIVKISKALNCSVDYLLGLTDVEYTVTRNSSIIPIPILSQTAAAGLGKETNHLSNETPKIEWFDRRVVPDNAEYGIIIEGDSMETKFHNGQIVFVKLADDCPNNQYGIFTISEDEITNVFFKQKIMLNNYTYALHSLNDQKYKDITDFKNKICKCIAVAVL